MIGNNHPLWVAPFPGQIPGLYKSKGNELNTNMNTVNSLFSVLDCACDETTV